MGARILIVEDEVLVGYQIKSILTQAGYNVIGVVRAGLEALQMVSTFRVDLILMDIKLSGEYDGIQTAQMIQRRFNIPVIYVTANAQGKNLTRMKDTHYHCFIQKPVIPEFLLERIESFFMTDGSCVFDERRETSCIEDNLEILCN